MAQLQIFTSEEFGTVRITTIGDEPYFVGKDVAEILGYADPNKAIAMHVDEEDKLNDKTASSLGQRGGWLINESGLYSLILSSKLPTAKKFKRWVTAEVLPSIRKNGGYIAGQESLSDDDLMAKAILVAQRKIEERDRIIEQKQARIEEMRPKEVFADAVSASTTSILVRDLAKLIKQNGVDMGEKRLYGWMRKNGYIIKNGTQPTQRSMELGLFEIIERSVQRSDMPPIVKQTTKVTGKGQQYFINKFFSSKGGD